MCKDRIYGKAHSAEPGAQRPCASPLWNRIRLFLVVLALGALFCSSPIRSMGDPPPSAASYIFLYNGDGSAANVTSYVYQVGSQVYVFPEDPKPITLDYEEGHVFDNHANVIGYISSYPDM